ncbi:MAG: 4'-phosphopantetheinyl transferase superfamily protein [Planctomycetota bacterium]
MRTDEIRIVVAAGGVPHGVISPEPSSRTAESESLVRRALTRCAPEVSESAWRLVRERSGQLAREPHSDCRPLEFSVSHSGNTTVVAVTDGAEIGIDIERSLPKHLRDSDLPCDFLSPSERASLALQDLDERNRRFLRHWTLKEAYAKARGFGLALAFDQLSFEIDEVGIRAEFGPLIKDSSQAWSFHSLSILEDITIGLATRSTSGRTVRIDRLPNEPVRRRA